MFDIPSNPRIEKCIVTKETVLEKKAPKLVINDKKELIKNKTSKPQRKNTNRTEETA